MISLDKYTKRHFSGGDEKEKKEFVFDHWNCDNVFMSLKEIGVEEIEVTNQQMLLIALNFNGNANKTEEGANALKTGKIDEYMGIKLILEK